MIIKNDIFLNSKLSVMETKDLTDIISKEIYNKEILIVDDDEENILLLESILSTGGFSVLKASNGHEAIELAKKNLPAIILLDIMMPEIDGFEICLQLKKDELTRLIPVIFVSAMIDENSKIKGFQSGGADFITKPYHHQELLARVHAHHTIRNLQISIENQNRQLKQEITERQRAENQLKENEERYRLISGLSTDYLFSTMILPDGSLDLNWVVGAFESISGFSVEEFKARGGWRATIHPDDIPIDENDFARLQNNQDIESELRTFNKKGEIVWVQVFAHPVWDETNNRLSGIFGAVKNITDRKHAEEDLRILNLELERRVIQRTMQLEASNKELEAFTYSVSHDLRAPLRAIYGFVKILEEEYGGQLDDEGKRICDIIHSNATKMGQLIDDLLSFSQLIRKELSYSKVDMESMVKNIISESKISQNLPQPAIALQKLPQSLGDVNLLRQVWVNLISNAIKYSSKTEHPQITIGAIQNENETIYFVKDNGVGFNMNYAHKLFGVFQRLHGAKEFEGTGVGLAIVQRIINRHKGRVWAEGEVGKGAVFYFSLPVGGAENE